MKTSRRLYVIAVAIIVVGIIGSTLIYLTASDDRGTDDGYAVVDGEVIPVTPKSSKMFAHNLELFGGKEAVVADEFDRWFASLWRGRTLAFTVGVLTIIIAAGIFFVASRLRTVVPPDADDANHRDGAG